MSDPRQSQEEKHKLNRASSKFKDPPRIMQSDDYFARKFKAINGNMGPPTLNVSNSSESGGPANGTPAVPKMGVRARVSEWPPKKDCSKELACKGLWESRSQTSYESVTSILQNGQNDQNDGQQEEQLDLEFVEAKYTIGDIFVHSPQRGLHPIRQRSNSDVTISDIDAEDVLDQNAVNPNTGAALHREYGSTSSIDRQGLSGENFFAMLRGYRVENYDHKAMVPFGIPEFFPCDPAISPSLHAAAQISRGEFVRISGLDYVDSALLMGRDRDKPFKWRLKSESVETSLFRKLRTVKSEHETFKFTSDLEDSRLERGVRPWHCQRCFAHYDVQSILFNINEAIAIRANVGKRKNITTGASAASQTQMPAGHTGNCESPLGSKEDLNSKENLDADEGDGKSNDLVLSCPYFRNETGGEGDRRIALSRANSSSFSSGESCSFESSLSSHCTNAGVSVLEVPRENQPIHREKVKRYIIEHIDLGAYYYRKFFYGKEHQNYFGIDENLGPVAISIRREKVEDAKEKEGSQFNYRVAFRTSELTTLRGAILEDAVPSTARHGTARGLPLKEVLEYVIPELSIQCLRQALNSPKVSEQLLKLDEQGLSFQHKIGILYCKAGQSTEEEMYNNETAGPAFEEFLDLLGQRVRLKGFSKYRAQLDNKTDSTGTHSLYTTYKDYELMFHVSTMLPYMPNNRQQLLRKRHIGNDIVTIVFQEPGALPFTPKSIRSHFQHVFVIVKVHNPCTENVCYSVGVSRSKDVPPFGPPIPKGVTFPKSAVFRDFLLAKVINAENAAHKSEKFRAMATRTRQEYLKDLAENFVTTATVDTSVKFSFITLGAKKKERVKPRKDAHLFSIGAIMWHVIARDFGQSADIECLLGISNEFIMLIEKDSKNVVFNCSCRDVIGWTSGLMSIKVFYERGECILLSAVDNCAEDVREIVQRLGIVTRGCETVEMTLRRNGLGQLGFHVNFEGIVADVEPFGFAWKAGLRQGSRLVEICKVAVATLTHEQMIDLLRTSVTVKVVIIQPHDDGSPRRGCSELCRIPMVEYKLDSEGTPCEYKTPFRRNTTWHRVPTPATVQPLSRASPVPGTPDRLQCQQLLQQAQAAIPRSTSFDRKLPDGTRPGQDVDPPQTPQCTVNDSGQHCRSSPSNQSSSSDPGPSAGGGHWRQQVAYDGCQSPLLLDHQGSGPLECEVAREREDIMEGNRHPETKWHGPPSKVLSSYKERALQKDGSCKDSPNKLSHIGDKSCSSHSSSNTLSSNTSSNSDDKHFGSGDLMDPELLGLTYIKGASTDSGIDTTPCMPTSILGPLHLTGSRSMIHSRAEQWADAADISGPDDEPVKMYAVHGYASAISISNTAEGSMGDLSEVSSHSSGSHRSGSPSTHCSKNSGSLDTSKVYIVSHSSSQQAPGSVSKPYHRQGAVSKYVIGWKKSEGSPPPEEPEVTECQGMYSEMDTMSTASQHQTVAGEAISETPHVLTKEDFLKLMLPDSPLVEEGRRKFSFYGNLSPRRSLYRTLSDESICSNRRGSSFGSSRSSILDQALPNDILFSTTPPYHSTLPPRTQPVPSMGSLRNEFWFSDGSLSDKSKCTDPGLMPLPDTATGLDWSHLVDAARAFEDQRVASFCTLTDMQHMQNLEGAQELPLCMDPSNGKDFLDTTGERSPSTLTGKVNQLELILRQLQTDLRKEKQDKAVLQAEVQHLRQDNMRLQEESQTATAQLRKFTEWFFSTIDKKP
ncbi:signal-induced proliferation-associated 1-like protein 2 isoform X1 [Elephas maximus indicus]|uniref:signal-induced proliferation-associated 1-like protein 2 isoform X1 n=1 Tax=Elephas maximus indicus TaxID=99487 RepID=UPI00211696CA|nr:signal-induced proliferation-associated 1-like protein 2 isoform X1 [Elephas maximus indicus]XP_049723862.1 signal-induced proliferation-associated 1-like protein 2 isoform X1 [Elephas maximus indicus]XP_049723863.1 signal-induced proliferation-associated 1-like protein 2 isoform X1 [Elephas maximus indicus]XP_049723864.1 signal-induced proliferation-associated 1-like protein 2 isoform X1 [Elephas maximus indicus]XP_049723865.1 signal-induced proliferation-associated 1-like protein 2 isoform